MVTRGPIAAALTIAAVAAGLAGYSRGTLTAVYPQATGWDVVADVTANPIFLGQIVLTAWLLLVATQLGPLLEPATLVRLGGRTRALTRDLAEAAGQILAAAALTLIAIFAIARDKRWSGWSSVTLTPGGGLLLAQQGWAPVPLLLLSVGQLACSLLAIRFAAVSLTLLTGRSAPTILLLATIWLLQAFSTLQISDGVPGLDLATAALSADRSAQVGLPVGVVPVVAAALSTACWLVLRGADRQRHLVGSQRAGAATLGAAGVLGLALVTDTLTRRPVSVLDAAATLTAGRSPDLIAYTLYSAVGLGYALLVVHHLESRFDGRLWQELIRAGSWRRWLVRRLGPSLLLIPGYLTALLLLVLLAAVPTGLVSTTAPLPLLAAGYLLNGSLQIALYTAVLVAAAVFTGDVRWAWITACAIFLLGSPFVPDNQLLPIGIYHLTPDGLAWPAVVQQLLLLAGWGVAGICALLTLMRKRVLHVAV